MAGTWLVTGANGFVGRHLCAYLVGHGARVKALVRRPVAADELPGSEIVVGALDDAESYQAALQNVEYVVHVAANPNFGNGPGYIKDNVEPTVALIAALRGAPALRRLVYVSTIGAVDRAKNDPMAKPLVESSPPHPASDYGRSKLEAERLVAASGLPFAIVRPTMVVGEDMRANSHMAAFAYAALAGAPLGRFNWPGAFSVIHVDDLASALECAATVPAAAGKTFFAAGEPVAIKDLYAWAAPKRARIPIAWAKLVLRPLLGMTPFALKGLLYPALCADDSALRALGWKPAFSGRAALEPVIARQRARTDATIVPQGRTVVTGAASGLGRALAERLAGMGRTLVLIDRNEAGLGETLFGRENVTRVTCDLADGQAITALVRSDVWTAEPVAELFASAGFGGRGAVASLSPDMQADMMAVNVSARIRLAHAAMASMKRRQFGRIVLISSSSAFQALPYMSVYAASNAAVLSFGEGLAAEAQGDGVEVLTICPGGMDTGFQNTAGVKKVEGEKLLTPDEVAAKIIAALGKGKFIEIVSFRSQAMALLARLLPRKMSAMLWARMMSSLR